MTTDRVPDTGLTLRQYYGMVGLGAFVTTIAQPMVIGRLPMRFVLKDDATRATVPVAYTGSVPDAFKPTRHVIVTGRMQDGVFVGEPDSLLTKCPSKYSSGGSG